MKISIKLGTHLGVLQMTNIRVMAMQARVILTSRFLITFDVWLVLTKQPAVLKLNLNLLFFIGPSFYPKSELLLQAL